MIEHIVMVGHLFLTEIKMLMVVGGSLMIGDLVWMLFMYPILYI